MVRGYGTILNPELHMVLLNPNEHGDWLSVRDEQFGSFLPMAPEHRYDLNAKSAFTALSRGLETSRDSWVYNYSRTSMEGNMRRMIAFYHSQVDSYLVASRAKEKVRIEDFIDPDSRKIAWTRGLKKGCKSGIRAPFDATCARIALYRPFVKLNAYVHRHYNEYSNAWPSFCPSPNHATPIICVSGVGGTNSHSTFITDMITDLNCLDSGTQCFPLYYYDRVEQEQASLFDRTKTEYVRRDGITDFILEQARSLYGPKVKKEDIFYYVYGLLHSPDYRTRYSADLKKMLPRIQLVEEPKAFWAFSKAGRDLAHWHLDYESIEPWPVKETKTHDNYTVDQMRFAKNGKVEDKSTINYNASITISGIPLEAYDYIVNGKSAIEWIMERYAVSVHKGSGIRNDPNDWAKEQGDPRYILDLLKRVIRVSIETVRVVKSLPPLPCT